MALRSWKLVPYAYYVRGYQYAQKLSREQFELLSQCDGEHELENTGLLVALERAGFVHEAQEGETWSEWSKPRRFDNRYFPSVNWAITGKCNFNCKHCFMAADNAPMMGEFNWGECVAFLDECERCGIQSVTLTGGEPMLHPRFRDIVREIARRGMYLIELNTNGSFLSAEFLDELKALGMDTEIKISFDGIGHHDWLRGVPNAEEKALRAMKLAKEKGFRVRSQTAEAADQLMGLPDLRSYMETAYMLDSDRYSSLGAVCLEIPDMARINGAQGFAYGSRLLWYASKTLTGLFGPSLVFRTGEAEFVAFCPNTTRQVFLGRCGRLRSILQRRYPKQVRLGQAWSDGVFNGKRLTEEARLLMGAAPAPAATRASAPPEGKPSPLAQAVKAGRLTVHFQPQVDMRTGQLIGAEALVRGMGEQGELIPPGKFIGLLEQDGSIRELDLYVLDRTLAQLDAWRQAGKPLRAAVNLSRVTALHPSLLASVLAIQSRYPQLPAGSLELELTESTGGGGTGQLGRVVEQLRGCGLRLALDDFGSQYANLSLFANVRFDTVKLDRSLLTGLVDNPISRALVRDLVQICHTYGMRCVAEGVETREQSEALLQVGCVYAQGYLYDRPLPPEQFWQRYLQDPPEREA